MPFTIIEKPIIDMRVRKLCQKPYHGHPKGCPNYDNKKGCPPNSPPISKVLDLNKEIYIIWNMFDFIKHCSRMETLHPQWSQRQIECCLYWQGTARKQLQNEICKFTGIHPHLSVVYPPESYGVNVTQTMEKMLGIELEWPPIYFTYQVAIAGYKQVKILERIKR